MKIRKIMLFILSGVFLFSLYVPAEAQEVASVNDAVVEPASSTDLGASALASALPSWPPDKKILLIDDGGEPYQEGQRALNAIGYPYTKVTAAQIPTVDLNAYNVIFVAWYPTKASVDALTARKADLEAWIKKGGGIAVNAEWYDSYRYNMRTPYSFLPVTFQVSTSWIHTNGVLIKEPTHPLVNNVTSTEISSWGNSVHGQITAVPPDATVVSVATSLGNSPHIVGMCYGGGKIVVMASDPEFHTVYGGAGASKILSNELLWAATSCNRAPVAVAGSDRTVECGGPSGTSVPLDGSQSYDPDGDPLSYTWTWNGGTASGPNPVVSLPVGVTAVALVVNDGKTDSAPSTVNITVQDTLPPETTIQSIGGVSGDNGWYRSDVTITLASTDSCTGVREVHAVVNGADTVTPGGSASVTITAEGNNSFSYFATDNAGNPETPHSLPVAIDKTAPVISILGVTDGASYPLCSPPTPSSTVVDSVSGVAYQLPVLTPPSNPNGAGLFTYTVTAADLAGNPAAATATYRLVYGFGGFLPPVTLNKPFKKGSTIPVKFALDDGCGAIAVSAVATLALQFISGEPPVEDPIDATSNVPDSGNVFRYSASDGGYIYNLSTQELSEGSYLATVMIDDGVARTVVINIKQ